MQFIQRTIILVVEALGVGEMPDAIKYGDEGSNSLSHAAEAVHGLKLPNFARLGLGNLTYITGLDRETDTVGFYGKARMRSDGKDSLIGHWEINGVSSESLFISDSEGFFPELVEKLQKSTGYNFISPDMDKRHDIINRLGEHHIATKSIIIYFDHDLSIKLGAHKDVMSREDFEKCLIYTREICDHYGIIKVEGTYFKGHQHGNFTEDGKPMIFNMKAPGITIMSAFRNANIPTISIGASSDIFPANEISEFIPAYGDLNALEALLVYLENGNVSEHDQSIVYITLSEINQRYATNRNTEGYVLNLEMIDDFLPRIFRSMNTADLLIITSSTGNDPTFRGEFLTREYLPIIFYSRLLNVRTHGNLGVRRTISDIAETLSEIYSLDTHYGAESFWSYMISQI